MGDLRVLEKVVNLSKERKEIALATITRSSGSSPRGVGTMMGVLGDGSIIGTIGGGPLEKHVVDLSLNALKTGLSQTFDLDLADGQIKMICGGGVEVFIDVYMNKPKLMIFGAGHVGHAIYDQARLLDFEIDVFDDREEFLNRNRFPKADKLFLGDLDDLLRDYNIDKDTYIVVVTRGHKLDEDVLERVVDSNAKYIGAMGSKKKIREIMESLKSKGLKEEKLKEVYAPIGLDIASQEPSEIAISILSEIILIKNKGKGNHRKMDLWS